MCSVGGSAIPLHEGVWVSSSATTFQDCEPSWMLECASGVLPVVQYDLGNKKHFRLIVMLVKC